MNSSKSTSRLISAIVFIPILTVLIASCSVFQIQVSNSNVELQVEKTHVEKVQLKGPGDGDDYVYIIKAKVTDGIGIVSIDLTETSAPQAASVAEVNPRSETSIELSDDWSSSANLHIKCLSKGDANIELTANDYRDSGGRELSEDSLSMSVKCLDDGSSDTVEESNEVELAGQSATEESERESDSVQSTSLLAWAFEDSSEDEVDCADESSVTDPAVDILNISAEQFEDGVLVRVRMNQRVLDSIEDYSISIQARIGRSTKDGGEGYQVGVYEFHEQKASRIGRLETVEEVLADTEGDVAVEDNEVLFFFPDTTIKEGDTLTAQAFHVETTSDRKNCDATKAFPLN